MPLRKSKRASIKKSNRPKGPYEYFSVAADTLVFRGPRSRLEILLIRRKYPPYKNCWAIPGGFLERDEDARTAAKRELREETGLKSAHLVEFGSFSRPDRDPRGRVVTISFYTVAKQGLEPKAGDDARDVAWFPVRKLPRLAFDHREMIGKALIHLVQS